MELLFNMHYYFIVVVNICNKNIIFYYIHQTAKIFLLFELKAFLIDWGNNVI